MTLNVHNFIYNKKEMHHLLLKILLMLFVQWKKTIIELTLMPLFHLK